MKSTGVHANVRHRRRIHYVDERVQKWLLVALVVMELALAGAAVGALYWHLSGVVEENLYRVHLPAAEPLFDQLMLGAQKVLGIFILINVIGLLLADAIWRHYVNFVVNDFMALIGKTGELDFSSDADAARGHEVLVRVRSWRTRERNRLVAIREELARLEDEVSGRGDSRHLRDLLDNLGKLMP